MGDTLNLFSLAFYVVCVFGICTLMIGLSWLLGEPCPGPRQGRTFPESGVVGVGSARMRMSAKFYLVAMFFVIFDAEALFLYAWAVSVKEAGWAGFVEAVIFITMLIAGLVYLWRIGALEWAPDSRKRLKQQQSEAK